MGSCQSAQAAAPGHMFCVGPGCEDACHSTDRFLEKWGAEPQVWWGVLKGLEAFLMAVLLADPTQADPEAERAGEPAHPCHCE